MQYQPAPNKASRKVGDIQDIRVVGEVFYQLIASLFVNSYRGVCSLSHRDVTKGQVGDCLQEE